MDALTIWTAIGVLVAALGPLGAIMHLSSGIERRFAILETRMEYIQRAVDALPRRQGD